MTEHPGFLQDILEHPDDDVPRLIYSDWLEENGQEDRAEFIRVQVELWRRRDEYKVNNWHGKERTRAYNALQVRERMLHERVLDWWGDEIPKGDPRQLYNNEIVIGSHRPPPITRVYFRRGFIASVDCVLSVWQEYGRKLATRHPIERVLAKDLPMQISRDRHNGKPIEIWSVNMADVPAGCHALVRIPFHCDSRGDLIEAVSERLIAWARESC